MFKTLFLITLTSVLSLSTAAIAKAAPGSVDSEILNLQFTELPNVTFLDKSENVYNINFKFKAPIDDPDIYLELDNIDLMNLANTNNTYKDTGCKVTSDVYKTYTESIDNVEYYEHNYSFVLSALNNNCNLEANKSYNLYVSTYSSGTGTNFMLNGINLSPPNPPFVPPTIPPVDNTPPYSPPVVPPVVTTNICDSQTDLNVKTLNYNISKRILTFKVASNYGDNWKECVDKKETKVAIENVGIFKLKDIYNKNVKIQYHKIKVNKKKADFEEIVEKNMRKKKAKLGFTVREIQTCSMANADQIARLKVMRDDFIQNYLRPNDSFGLEGRQDRVNGYNNEISMLENCNDNNRARIFYNVENKQVTVKKIGSYKQKLKVKKLKVTTKKISFKVEKHNQHIRLIAKKQGVKKSKTYRIRALSGKVNYKAKLSKGKYKLTIKSGNLQVKKNVTVR